LLFGKAKIHDCLPMPLVERKYANVKTREC
jgi:hypothetical protein